MYRQYKLPTLLALTSSIIIVLIMSTAAVASGGRGNNTYKYNNSSSVLRPSSVGSSSLGSSTITRSIDNRLYDRGKKVYKRHINCKGCVVQTRNLTKTQAESIIAQVQTHDTLKSRLTSKQQKAVVYYLKTRFHL